MRRTQRNTGKPKHPRKWVSWQDGDLPVDDGKPRNPERRNDMEELREKMLEYRARHQMSQTTLAEACGVSYQTINSIESGKQTPSALTKTKIMLVVGKEEK